MNIYILYWDQKTAFGFADVALPSLVAVLTSPSAVALAPPEVIETPPEEMAETLARQRWRVKKRMFPAFSMC